ncbi:response regulator [Candidatus Woesearchaeota archaeon]|nr:response regulator [Candidatus Woesearchaeota archaeon]
MALEYILVADDTPEFREKMVAAFHKMGYITENNYQVKEFMDGKTLLNFYHKHSEQVSMILTDNQMPEMTGLDIMRNLDNIVYVISSTPRLKERVKNDPTLRKTAAQRIYDKYDENVYGQIIDNAIEKGLLKRLK